MLKWFKRKLIGINSLLARCIPVEYLQKSALGNWKRFWKEWNPDELFPDTVKMYQTFIDRHFLTTLKPESQVLDLGCAEGVDSIAAAKKCRHVYGIDISPAFLKAGEENTVKAGINNVTFLERNILEWCQHPDGIPDIERRIAGQLGDSEWSISHIILDWFFQYIFDDKDLMRILNVCYDILPSDGICLLKDSLASGDSRELFSAANGYMAVYRTPDECRRMLKDAGFAIVEENHLSFDKHSHYIFLLRKL
ncbi:MAG: class I SAM-dependent methyltransferase [Planctomycetaceae bacterium]|nr:class I SAM-dependent methyltransferase [Planctomycetaceae bacterium]